ncbi:hypothetical protein TNCV_3468771 [Trichonephila clavipes]|nr:hypothetical protein TNCV_3468771 [Trichonephila clavipes]
MVHQISYSIFEVGGEAIPVMPLREKKGRPRNDNSAGSSSRTMFRNQRGSVTNIKKMVLESPLLAVWILRSLTATSMKEGGSRVGLPPR